MPVRRPTYLPTLVQTVVCSTRTQRHTCWEDELWAKRDIAAMAITSTLPPVSVQLTDTNPIGSTQLVMGLPKHGREIQPEIHALALDGRSKIQNANSECLGCCGPYEVAMLACWEDQQPFERLTWPWRNEPLNFTPNNTFHALRRASSKPASGML